MVQYLLQQTSSALERYQNVTAFSAVKIQTYDMMKLSTPM